MKKTVLVLIALFLMTGQLLAGSSIVRNKDVPDVIFQDSPEWSGTRYDGLPMLFDGVTIAGNVNYLRSVEFMYGPKLYYKGPGQTNATLQPIAYVKFVYKGSGDGAFKLSIAQYDAWKKNRSKSSVQPTPVVLEDSGVLFNPQDFNSLSYESCTPMNPGPQGPGCYEFWSMTTETIMTIDQFNAFKTQFDSWNPNLIKAHDVAIGDGKSSGRLVVYHK